LTKNPQHILLVFIILLLFVNTNGKAQVGEPYFLKTYPDTLHKKRLGIVLGAQGLIYATTLAVLYQAWYKDYPQSSFHWLNDNNEWMQIDKLGHATTAAYLGKFGYEFYRNAGVKRKKAIWFGGSAGFFYLTIVEILDGFSAEWGASAGDLIANAAGAGLFIGQQLGWDEQRFNLKFSYHPSDYAKYNPDLLGSTGLESVLKDYNGQTYWLSGNIKSFMRKKESRFPSWLNVAVGYGADGMIGASSNPTYDDDGNELPDFPRYRQWYLTFDVDLTKIKTRRHGLKFLFNALNLLKIPFPTIEYNKEQGWVFHPLYF